MAQTKLVLLEQVDNLGAMGDIVTVRPGYARNYLLPAKKALRASKENIAYFEARRKHLEAENEKRRAEAGKLAEKLGGLTVPLIRQASESGQLYGSVTARDVAQGVTEQAGEKIGRHMVELHQGFKTIGLFPVTVALHPEVKIEVTVNVARTEEEAKTQAETGKALIVEEGRTVGEAAEEAVAEAREEQLEEMLEDSALAAEKEKRQETGQEEEGESGGQEAGKAKEPEEKESEEKAGEPEKAGKEGGK